MSVEKDNDENEPIVSVSKLNDNNQEYFDKIKKQLQTVEDAVLFLSILIKMHNALELGKEGIKKAFSLCIESISENHKKEPNYTLEELCKSNVDIVSGDVTLKIKSTSDSGKYIAEQFKGNSDLFSKKEKEILSTTLKIAFT